MMPTAARWLGGCGGLVPDSFWVEEVPANKGKSWRAWEAECEKEHKTLCPYANICGLNGHSGIPPVAGIPAALSKQNGGKNVYAAVGGEKNVWVKINPEGGGQCGKKTMGVHPTQPWRDEGVRAVCCKANKNDYPVEFRRSGLGSKCPPQHGKKGDGSCKDVATFDECAVLAQIECDKDPTCKAFHVPLDCEKAKLVKGDCSAWKTAGWSKLKCTDFGAAQGFGHFVKVANVPWGGSCTLECFGGGKRGHATTTTCEEHGKQLEWPKGAKPQCGKYFCTEPPFALPRHVKWKSACEFPIAMGARCEMGCEEGYTIIKGYELTEICRKGGPLKYDRKYGPLICEREACALPALPANGHWGGECASPVNIGTSCEVECKNTHFLLGNPKTRICTKEFIPTRPVSTFPATKYDQTERGQTWWEWDHVCHTKHKGYICPLRIVCPHGKEMPPLRGMVDRGEGWAAIGDKRNDWVNLSAKSKKDMCKTWEEMHGSPPIWGLQPKNLYGKTVLCCREKVAVNALVPDLPFIGEEELQGKPGKGQRVKRSSKSPHIPPPYVWGGTISSTRPVPRIF